VIFRPLAASLMVFATLCAGCAGGGGATGTGITTAQGTIASADTASRPARKRGGAAIWLARALDVLGAPRTANAVGGVEGVRVSVQGTTISAESDASGFFSLSGSFGGPTTLLFSADDGRPPRRLDVDVPTGGTLTLDGVRLEGPDDRAHPDAQRLDFEGVVATKNCGGGSLSMVSSVTPDDGNSYPVDVVGATLRDSSGAPIHCDDLAGGDLLSVQGEIRSDGAIDCQEADRRPPGDFGRPGPH